MLVHVSQLRKEPVWFHEHGPHLVILIVDWNESSSQRMSVCVLVTVYRWCPLYRVYECNSNCQCGRTCANRLVQLGLQLRLQVFRTQNKFVACYYQSIVHGVTTVFCLLSRLCSMHVHVHLLLLFRFLW